MKVWIALLIEYINSMSFDAELKESLIETYKDPRMWELVYEQGMSPQDAFDEEISYWSYQ